MENVLTVTVFVALMVIVVLILELRKRSRKIQELEGKVDYHKYQNEARDYLLCRAFKINLLPSVRFTFNEYTIGKLLIYEDQDNDPKVITCIRGEDGNIHEISSD